MYFGRGTLSAIRFGVRYFGSAIFWGHRSTPFLGALKPVASVTFGCDLLWGATAVDCAVHLCCEKKKGPRSGRLPRLCVQWAEWGPPSEQAVATKCGVHWTVVTSTRLCNGNVPMKFCGSATHTRTCNARGHSCVRSCMHARARVLALVLPEKVTALRQAAQYRGPPAQLHRDCHHPPMPSGCCQRACRRASRRC